MEPRALFKEVRRLRKQGETDQALRVLADALRRGSLPDAHLERAGRTAAELLGDDIPHVRILGQCTVEWLAHVLVARGVAEGQPLRVSWGEFDSVMPEAMALAGSEDPPDAVVLLPWDRGLLAGATGTVAERVDATVGFWQQVWGVLAGAPGTRILQVGLDARFTGPMGVHAGAQSGEIAVARQASAALRDALPTGAWFVDLERVAGDVGRRHFYDHRQYHWAKQPFTHAGLAALAAHLHAGLRGLRTGPRKVLVLDLDNTCWGGVVGDEGPLGVRLGDDAEGEAFRHFQAWARSLTARGILLAVATKNNEADAREPFEQNPAMVLSLDDLAAFEAHWEPKTVSLQRIASTLNLGLDSLVFVDDNPAEREIVRQTLPQVHVVELPEDPSLYVAAVEAGLHFETVGVTDADRKRARQYKAEAKRKATQATFTSLDDYWESLEMKGDARAVDAGDLPRVVQLVGKTNQFNLTTRRHPHDRVAAWTQDPACLCLTLRVADRFGDHGLVSVMLAVPTEPGEPGHDAGGRSLRVDTWLMSCRVIARTVEQAFFSELVRRARDMGVTRLVGEYIPTKKNGQVADLWTRVGATPLPPGDGELRQWVLDLDGFEPPAHFVDLG